MFAIILIIIMVGVFAGVMTQGFWSNTLTLVNVLAAGLLATNYFEPLAAYFDKNAPGLTYVWDFISIWLIFIGVMSLLRALTDYLSQVKVRFPKLVEIIGNYVMALWISWAFMCFAAATFHTAPFGAKLLVGLVSVGAERLDVLRPRPTGNGWGGCTASRKARWRGSARRRRSIRPASSC